MHRAGSEGRQGPAFLRRLLVGGWQVTLRAA